MVEKVDNRLEKTKKTTQRIDTITVNSSEMTSDLQIHHNTVKKRGSNNKHKLLYCYGPRRYDNQMTYNRSIFFLLC